MFNFSGGDPKSLIDYENGKIILRCNDYPKKKNAQEWIIHNDVIEISTVKKIGIIDKEIIQISQIRDMKLTRKIGGHSCDLLLKGVFPRLKGYRDSVRYIIYTGSDIFVGHAAYAYIFEKCHKLNIPLKAEIDPLVTSMRAALDAGEIDEATIRGLKAKGVDLGMPAPDEIPTQQSVEKSESQESSPIQSAADEILKLKNLLDAGIITQEEFDHKKKILLKMD